MKLLTPINHDDLNTLRKIAESRKTKSYPMLSEYVADFEARYQHYLDVRGNGWEIEAPLNLDVAFANAVKGHYESKPVDLKVIDKIRDELSPDICPLCGSFNSNEVDHVLPKDIYPEYAFFTRNLVPACACNKVKGIKFIGEQEGERVLHPYFDTVLRSRLAYVSLIGDLDAPRAEIIICLPFQKDLAVRFHVREILMKTRILNWAGARWAKIRRMPEKVFPLLLKDDCYVTNSEVHDAVMERLEANDLLAGTPNNWESMVYWGILASTKGISYITKRVNDLRSGKIVPD